MVPEAECDFPCLREDLTGFGPEGLCPTRHLIRYLDPDVAARMNHSYFSLLPFDSVSA